MEGWFIEGQRTNREMDWWGREELKDAEAKRWPDGQMEDCSNGERDKIKKILSFLRVPLHPFIHLLQVPLPLDRTSVCSLSETPALENSSPSVIYVQIQHRIQTTQTRHHLYSHDNRPPLPPPPASSGAIRRAADRERDHSGRGRDLSLQLWAWSLMFRLNCYRIDVDAKVAGSENWHDRGDLAGGCQRTGVSKCDAAP